MAAAKTQRLHLGVTDIPSWSSCLLFGFQQAMLCISGLLVYPFVVSECVCAGDATIELRVKLIAATFVASGVATLLQTTFGLRLSLLHGPAIAFLPPLLAYQALHPCQTNENDHIDPNIWMDKLQEIGGSLVIACLSFVIIGFTGVAGILSLFVGPITITPLMLLLTISIVPTMEEKLSLHWISIVMLLCVACMAIYMENVRVPFPYYSLEKESLLVKRLPIFGQFPYLVSIALVWSFCYLMTVTDLEPINGEARTDKNATMTVLKQTPWFQIPYPGQFGFPKLSVGLCFGYVASCISSMIENIGSYDLAARVSEQKSPPRHAVNRAIMIEGVGSILAASMGVSTGVTTYSENIALIHITKVASRRTMQIAGLILILLGVFTKCAALLASIPDALVGGVLTMGISMIAGVTLSNLQQIDLSLTRNLAIMGLALMLGLVVPRNIERAPIATGHKEWDGVLNMLLSIKMLVGGCIAAILDNTVPGATPKQRGLDHKHDNARAHDDVDAYIFSPTVMKAISKIPLASYIPIFPTLKESTTPKSQDLSTV
ncbi:unnamed protein product [Auanema sp. JU1783]|nr:unnamed protein product [Auanema sp. JU1783]